MTNVEDWIKKEVLLRFPQHNGRECFHFLFIFIRVRRINRKIWWGFSFYDQGLSKQCDLHCLKVCRRPDPWRQLQWQLKWNWKYLFWYWTDEWTPDRGQMTRLPNTERIFCLDQRDESDGKVGIRTPHSYWSSRVNRYWR